MKLSAIVLLLLFVSSSWAGLVGSDTSGNVAASGTVTGNAVTTAVTSVTSAASSAVSEVVNTASSASVAASASVSSSGSSTSVVANPDTVSSSDSSSNTASASGVGVQVLTGAGDVAAPVTSGASGVTSAATDISLLGGSGAGTVTGAGGGVGGDPHFKGIQGEKYDVMGENLKWFNILSDYDVSVNAYFLNVCGETSTVMGELSFLYLGDKVLLNRTAVNFNGDVLELKVGESKVLKAGLVITRVYENKFTVSTPNYTFTLVRWIRSDLLAKAELHRDCALGNFDMDVDLKTSSVKPHGLLGQTAHHKHSKLAEQPKVHSYQGEGEIEGTFVDYEVSSAFSTDFKYNKYLL